MPRQYLPDNLKDDLKQKWSRFKPLAETDSRLNLIAFDLADHFVNYCLPKKLKGEANERKQHPTKRNKQVKPLPVPGGGMGEG